MNQLDTTQSPYSRVAFEGLDNIPGYLSNDIFNERVGLRNCIGNINGYSIPPSVASRLENNIVTYMRIYLLAFFIIFIPSLYIRSLSPLTIAGIFVLLIFVLCFIFSNLLTWLLFAICITSTILHGMTRTHVEEVLTSDF
ncbi:PRA1 family protein [Entamoeba marina]